MDDFFYLDELGEVTRPCTLDNIRLALSAQDWVHAKLDVVVKTCYTHQHPALFETRNGWYLHKVDHVFDNEIHVTCMTYLGGGGYESADLIIPVEWINDQVGVSEIIKFCDEEVAKRLAKEAATKLNIMQQHEAAERAMLLQLQQKYTTE